MDYGGTPLGLPLELFAEICHLAVFGQNPVSPLLLGKICRDWRCICYGMPNLWTRPILNLKADGPQLDLLRAWIERALHLPLTFSILDPTSFLNPTREPEQCKILLQILAEKAPQVESLTLDAPSLLLVKGAYNLQSIFSYHWAILACLHLSYRDDGVPYMFKNCPQLIDFRFSTSTFWSSSIGTLPWIPWQTLLHVTIPNLASDDLMRVLRLAPNLETFHSPKVFDDVIDYHADDIWEVDDYLTDDDTPPPELMITHHRLKEWTFSQKDEEYLFQAFHDMQLLHLPALKSLKLEWGSTWEDGYPYNRLAMATKGWGCQLEELDVWLGGFEEESLTEWIRAGQLSSLRRLKLHWEWHTEGFSSVLFKPMTATEENDPVLPNLESLIV